MIKTIARPQTEIGGGLLRSRLVYLLPERPLGPLAADCKCFIKRQEGLCSAERPPSEEPLCANCAKEPTGTAQARGWTPGGAAWRGVAGCEHKG